MKVFCENAVIFAATAERSDKPPQTRDIPSVSNSSWKPLDETICCDFSADGKMFAWSLGSGFVGVMMSENQDNVHFDSVFYGIQSLTRVIDCGENVTSMLFLPKVEGSSKHNTYAMLAVGLLRGPIKVWNAATGEVCNILFDHSSKITALTFSSLLGNSLLISSSHDKTLKVWDLSDNGNMCLTIRGHRHQINGCAYSPSDPHMIASVGNGREVFLWNLIDNRHVMKPKQLIGHRNDVRSCSFSPDGALLATASNDSTVIIWDVVDKNKLITLGHKYPMPSSIYAGGANGYWVNCVVFSKDGTKLLTTCEDNRVRIWHLYDENVKVDEFPLDKVASKCAFSPNGKFAAVGQVDGSVKIMLEEDTQVSSLCHLSRMGTRKSVSNEQLQQFQNSLPYFINQYLRYKC